VESITTAQINPPLLPRMEREISMRYLQTLGLTTIGIISGASGALSVYVVPCILDSPTPLMLRQWKHAYTIGKNTVPTISAIPALGFAYLAFDAYNNTRMILPHQWKGYLTATVLALSLGPYTYAFMLPTNHKLFEKVEETKELAKTERVTEVGMPKNETAHALVDKWALLNLGRTALLVASTVCATWSALA
jgi:hypothetical protein